MSQRNLPARAPRDLIGRILETPDLPKVVQRLEPAVLHQLVQKCGLDDAGPIVAFATTHQLMGVFDHDLWQAARAGAADEFDADRFGLWLEVLVEAGAELAARKVAELDFDLVTAAFSRHLLVLDAEWNAIERRDAALLDEVMPDLAEQLALAEAVLENGLELGGFRIVPRRGAPWDALIEILARLSSDHPALYGRLMVRCGALSTEYIEDNGGLFDVLTSDEQVLSDAAGERDERRAQEGYVGPPEAAAFLKLARQPVGSAPAADPLTTRYFRKLDARAAASRQASASSATASHEPSGRAEAEGRRFLEMLQQEGVLPASQPPLLPAGEMDAPDRLARVRAQLLYVREHDSAAYARRSDELGYLANVLVAGCSFQSRRFRPVEAADAVLAVCNLGLENRPHAAGRVLPAAFLVEQELVTVFRWGWSVLHERVCLDLARRLVRALADLRIDDVQLQHDLTQLRIRMAAQLEAGTPWQERDRLDVLAILDPPAWATLLGLVDECPVVPKPSSKSSGRPPLRVTTEFEFISENGQIEWARDFVDSLPGRLAA
jgi:Family of unknown function (DUF6178)